MSVRVRFAPSPTGHLHIGGLRTALFNWLFARHHGGTFLVRIEDTDLERSKATFTESILDSLEWADLQSDEPLVTQTERMAIYKQHIDQLVQEKKAYRCFCAAQPMRSEEDYFKYDGKCRIRKPQPGDEQLPHVVRITLPLEQKTIEFDDSIRGRIIFETTQLDDFIIARTDGSPIYNFVVVVDDALMKITHVIRGEDHISNTPKQIVLYQAFGFPLPQFAHLPLILGPSGARLSKRDAATAVTDYKKNGYLADALCNYLVRLGWSHGDQEIFTRAELIKLFTLDAVGKKSAIFDQNKLDSVNSTYIRSAQAHDLLVLMLRDVRSDLKLVLEKWDDDRIIKAIALYKDRVKTLVELAREIEGLYCQSMRATKDEIQLTLGMAGVQFLDEYKKLLERSAPEMIGQATKDFAQQKKIKLVELTQPLRLALTGKINGPGVFDLIYFLTLPESSRRIASFLTDYVQS
jgi:glutamyl-tRNA synthetase